MIKEQEIPTYRKSTNSNVSKSRRKTDHKHNYEECLIQYRSPYFDKEYIFTHLASYCTICGKLGPKFKDEKSVVTDYKEIIDSPIGKVIRVLSGEELYKRYKDALPIFFLKDISDKYVPLWQNNEK